MEPYAQYHQQPGAYPHAHQQPPHPNQASPIMQTQQQPNYAQHGQPQQMAPPQMMSQLPYNPAYGMQQPYGVSPSQAAAMATAAASGYPSYTMGDQSSLGQIHQTSPRMQQVKTDGSNLSRQTDQSPRQPGQMGAPGTMSGQMNMPPAQAMPSSMPQPMPQQQIPQRRMSHVGASPAVQNPQQAGTAMAPPRATAPPQQVPQPQQAQAAPQQSPEVPAAGQVEESPLYVNAKQFHRILKRRMARQKLEEALRLTNKGRKPYLHESRHNHAMRRPRGPGGRFLTAEEVSQMEARSGDGKETNGEGENGATNGSAKRKAREMSGGVKSETPSKKVKSDEEDEEDEDEDADDG